MAGDLNRSAFVAAGGVDGHEPTERPTRASRAVLRWSARHGKRGPVDGNAVREEPGMSRRGVRQQPKHKAARPDIYRRRTQHEIWAAAPRRRRVGVCQTRQEGQRGGHLRCQRGPSVRRRVVCAGQLGGDAPQDVQIRRLTQHLGQRDPGRRVWGARLHAIPCLAPHLRFRLRACALAPATQEHGAAAGTSRQRDHTEVWDALIGSVAAATATMVQPTGSSEQPAQYGERRGERATSFRRVIWIKVGNGPSTVSSTSEQR